MWNRTIKKLKTGIKKCPMCNTDKPFSEFYKSKERSDGHKGCCKKCSLIIKRRTNEKHPETRKKYNKKYLKENRKKIMNKRKEIPEKTAYAHAKCNMKKRGLIVELTFKEFSNIMHLPCTYCGSNHKIGSVDRIDSSKGYVKGNIQPACYRCNEMKMEVSHEDFISHVNKIYQYLNKKGA